MLTLNLHVSIVPVTCRCVKNDSFFFKYWAYDWKVTALTTAVKCCREGFKKFYGLSKRGLAHITEDLKETTGHKKLTVKMTSRIKRSSIK